MTIHLDHKRKDIADILGKLQHFAAGFPLFYVGLKKLGAGEEIPVAFLEMSIAAVVIFTFIRELRAMLHRRKHPSAEHEHPAVGWFDLAAGVLLMFEAFHGEHHKAFYLRAPFVAAVVALGLGLSHSWIHRFAMRRRYLKLDETGVECRTAPFRKFAFEWTDLASIDMAADRVVFQRTDGREHVLRLRGLHNRNRVQEAVESQARTAGLLRGSEA